MVLLGKKTFGWKVKLFLMSILWATSTSPTRKSWSEFKYGLISHEHEFDHDNPVNEKSTLPNGQKIISKHYPCKHYGCNTVSVTELDGSFIKLIYLK